MEFLTLKVERMTLEKLKMRAKRYGRTLDAEIKTILEISIATEDLKLAVAQTAQQSESQTEPARQEVSLEERQQSVQQALAVFGGIRQQIQSDETSLQELREAGRRY